MQPMPSIPPPPLHPRKGGPQPFLTTAALLLATMLAFLAPLEAYAVRLKDLASIKGVRNNQLVGYGLVVGLNGTGDGSQTAFTRQGLVNMLEKMGVHVTKDSVKVKNVAGVMITAQLQPFAKIGQNMDVTLSSLGDATSLQGGTLMATQLKGLDGKVYAIAQGAISIGGFESTGPAASGVQKNHPTVARIPNGATVENEVPVSFAGKDTISLSLDSPDFTTVSRMVTAIDGFLGGAFAAARDGGTVDVTVPDRYRGKEVALLAGLEKLEVTPDALAKVVLDERTGTVVMGENVRISRLALSHGNLSLLIQGGQRYRLAPINQGTTLGEVVRALNSIGVSTRDLIAIFHSIKASGALQAELEIL